MGVLEALINLYLVQYYNSAIEVVVLDYILVSSVTTLKYIKDIML